MSWKSSAFIYRKTTPNPSLKRRGITVVLIEKEGEIHPLKGGPYYPSPLQGEVRRGWTKPTKRLDLETPLFINYLFLPILSYGGHGTVGGGHNIGVDGAVVETKGAHFGFGKFGRITGECVFV